MKNKIVISAILTIALCFSLIAGSTLAMFTSSSDVNVAISSSKVEVVAKVRDGSLKLYSGAWNATTQAYDSVEQAPITVTNSDGEEETVYVFANTVEGKSGVSLVDNQVKINDMSPMDKVEFVIDVTNKSTIDIKYQTIISQTAAAGASLFDVLKVSIVDAETGENLGTVKTGNNAVTKWAEGFKPETTKSVKVTIELPEGTGEGSQALSASLTYSVAAVQANAHTLDPVEDVVDDKTVYIYTVQDLKDLAEEVNSGANTYDGYTVKLMGNLDLAGESWTPIGDANPNWFEGAFDGNGMTVTNLKVDSTDNGVRFAGLFGVSRGPIKNLNVVGADVVGTYSTGVIVGHTYSDVINCSVQDATVLSKLAVVAGGYADGNNVGALVGYAEADGKTDNKDIYGCSVKNVSVTGFRCVGGLVGSATKSVDICDNTLVNVTTSYYELPAGGIEVEGKENSNMGAVAGRLLSGSKEYNNTVDGAFHVSSSEGLISALAAAPNGVNTVLALAEGEYTNGAEQIRIPSGKSITLQSVKGADPSKVVVRAYLMVTGTLYVNDLTIAMIDKVTTSTDTSQYTRTAIGLMNEGDLFCKNVTFDMTNAVSDASAITAWWGTGMGANITVENCVFNCGGRRPIRADSSVTVKGCTFNDPYRYAVQLTASNAVVNFTDNVINAGTSSTKTVVYGLQLEGEEYGCHDLAINGSGNVINLGETGKTAEMYYCECGKVDHATVYWNVTDGMPVHEVNP